MSRISDLRGSEKNKINLINIIDSFVTDTKYIAMYQKLYKAMIQQKYSIVETKTAIINQIPTIDEAKLDALSDMEIIFMYQLITQIIPAKANKDFTEFCIYNDENKIANKDLHSYNSFSEVFDEVKKVREKEEEKLLEKQIITLLDNDEWLILKPLSHKASLKYGARTKWCTATKGNKTYFNQYFSNGVLIYIIHKKDNVKTAIHKKIQSKETTYWNAKDNEMDVFDMNLTPEAYDAIKVGLSTASNKKLFHEMNEEMIVDENGRKVKAPKSPYRSKSQLLSEVEKQYQKNERWSQYIKTLKNSDGYRMSYEDAKRKFLY